MEQMAINWTNFGWTLAGEFLFGLLFAALVRRASRMKLVAQTAWAVAIGVTGTLLIAIPVFGLQLVALFFCLFFFSGVSMIVEYLLRVQDEIRKDTEHAQGIAKDLLK